MSKKRAVSVVLYLSMSGVSSGKRFVAEVGFRVRRREPITTALGLGVRGVRPVVDGGGIVANRRPLISFSNFSHGSEVAKAVSYMHVVGVDCMSSIRKISVGCVCVVCVCREGCCM